jgi:hypothetical protein
VDRKPSRASDRKASRADPAGRVKAAGKAAGAGVPLTILFNRPKILRKITACGKNFGDMFLSSFQ